jgi:hypothetical protein
MKKTTQEVGVDVTGKRQYVAPEIEVINLDEQPKLLSGSAVPRSFGAGLGDDESEDW